MKGKFSVKHYDLIRYPVVTEKTNLLGEKDQYVFVVDSRANKIELKGAVEALFGVKVKKVNTLVRKGKERVFRGRRGRLSDTKRAFFTLESGHKIDLTGIGN